MQSLAEMIQELDKLTEGFLYNPSMPTPEGVAAFLDRREYLVDRITSSAGMDTNRQVYKALIDNILSYDGAVVKRLNTLKEEAQTGIDKVTFGRIRKNAYEINYTMDSVFFDKKK
jgi:hypothetical protein